LPRGVEGSGDGGGGGGGGGVDPLTQMAALKPPFRGVHFSLPSFEYLELQQPFWHAELEEQNAQSPSAEPATQMAGLKPPTGVHFNLPSFEYLELQHPLLH